MAKLSKEKAIMVRKALKYLAGFCAGGIFVYKMAPELFPQIRQSWWIDESKEVPQDYNLLLNKVAAKMEIENPEKIKLFISKSPSLIYAGSPYLPNGAAIGLPVNALYRTQEDVMENVNFKGQTINWKTKGGKILLENLQLNDGNISFIIAHNLARMKNFDYLLGAVSTPCWFFATLELAKHALRKNAMKASPSTAPVVIGFVSGLSFAMYMQFTYFVTEWTQSKADELAGSCDLDVLNGGIDYIVKQMRVNQVLKALMEDDKEEMFNHKGDDLRSREIPLSLRLKYLDDIAIGMREKHKLTAKLFSED